MKLLISVIIPAYNIEKYIDRCLESVCKQTYENLEIIVVDDGSKDNTGKILDQYAKRDKRILVIHKQNAGVSAARNTGLEYAKGEYIGFVDGDDIIDDDMYELLLNNALKYEADISHCGYKMVFPNRVDYYYNTGEVRVQDNYQGIYDLIKADKVEPGLCNKLYQRALLEGECLNDSIRINEDLLFNYQLFKKSKKAVFEDLPKYHYMVRVNSASTSRVNEHKLKDPIKVIQFMMQQETGEIYQLLEKRYMYLLEKVSVMKNIEHDANLLKYQRERKSELKQLLKRGELKAIYSKKEMLQLKLASSSPQIYQVLHEVYARVTGSKDKYKV